MSIIGPRPLLVQYLSFIHNEHQKRHVTLEVRPGLTGWEAISPWSDVIS
ncbi:sugar transferase [Proteiniborus sp. MB09-C3]